MRAVCAAVVLSLLASTMSSAPLAAKRPGADTGGPPPGEGGPALTEEQIASQQLKESLIAGVAAATSEDGATTQYCPTAVGTQSYCGTSPPWRVVLAVHARQQERCDWCGPAVAQIMSNYTHRTSGNVYRQADIARWMGTSAVDCTGDGRADPGTCLGYFIHTLNAITVKPPNWAYTWKYRPTFTNWHNTIISGVNTWRMPLATTLRPWSLDNKYRLVSWPYRSNGGHYIELHGYSGYATSSNPTVFYSDTAGWCGSGTTAGNWEQSSWVVHRLMLDHGYLVY